MVNDCWTHPTPKEIMVGRITNSLRGRITKISSPKNYHSYMILTSNKKYLLQNNIAKQTQSGNKLFLPKKCEEYNELVFLTVGYLGGCHWHSES